jgi:hypothetical protein
MRPTKFLAVALVFWASSALAASSEFTYQGQLESNSLPASGNVDFQFTLFDSVTAGSQVGSPVTQTNVAVSNGLFTTSLDFGSMAFGVSDRWLEIAVRPTGSSTFTTLTPRQKVTAAPYALTAVNNVNLAGDTMTGPLYLPIDGLIVGTAQLVVQGGNIGLGTASPRNAIDIVRSGQGAFINMDDGAADYYTTGNYQGTFYLSYNRSNGSGGASIIYFSPSDNQLTLYQPVAISNGYALAAYSLSGSYVLTSCNGVYLVDSTNGSVTVTLPSASSTYGQVCMVKHKAGTNAVSVAAPAGSTIDGASSVSLTTANAARQIISDGSNWYVFGQ